MIMEAVAQSEEPLTPTEINRSIGLPKQSIHRLCQTMLEEGFLIRDVSGKRLRPAPRALNLARGILASQNATIARRQVLNDISEATGETVNFVVPEPNGMTYLDRVETDWMFRIELPVGSLVPFHCTASGKCYLASLSEKARKRAVTAISFEARTGNTVTDISSLNTELNQVSSRGYAVDNEEFFEGMIAIAVPVRDGTGRFFGALAVHGPTQRLNHDILLDHLPRLKEGAKKLADLNM